MLRLLEWLIMGHLCKWTIHKEEFVTYADCSEGWRFVLRCEKCGAMTTSMAVWE